MIRIPDRGCQGLVQVFFVFLVASPFGFAAFFVLGFLLQITSCFKLCTGNVTGWVVTERAPSKADASKKERGNGQTNKELTRNAGANDVESGRSAESVSTADTDDQSTA